MVTVLATKEELAKEQPKLSTRRLDLPAWMAAWDSYALGAAVLGQMTYKEAMSHKQAILEV